MQTLACSPFCVDGDRRTGPEGYKIAKQFNLNLKTFVMPTRSIVTSKRFRGEGDCAQCDLCRIRPIVESNSGGGTASFHSRFPVLRS